jgi:hypothetical protein
MGTQLLSATMLSAEDCACQIDKTDVEQSTNKCSTLPWKGRVARRRALAQGGERGGVSLHPARVLGFTPPRRTQRRADPPLPGEGGRPRAILQNEPKPKPTGSRRNIRGGAILTKRTKPKRADLRDPMRSTTGLRVPDAARTPGFNPGGSGAPLVRDRRDLG